jgi:hypothetical protein
MTIEAKSIFIQPETSILQQRSFIPEATIDINAEGKLPFVDYKHNHEDRSFRVSSKGAPGILDVDFTKIADLIAQEPQMTHIPSSELKKSWDEGLAVAVFDEEQRIVGYTRLKSGEAFIPQDEREARVLRSGTSKTPYEIASVILRQEVAGKGLASIVLEATMALKIDEVRRGGAVFTTTTELPNLPFVNALKKAAKNLGVGFDPIVHTSVQGIAQAACGNCAGINKCAKRVSAEGIHGLVVNDTVPELPQNCVLYLSKPMVE